MSNVYIHIDPCELNFAFLIKSELCMHNRVWVAGMKLIVLGLLASEGLGVPSPGGRSFLSTPQKGTEKSHR